MFMWGNGLIPAFGAKEIILEVTNQIFAVEFVLLATGDAPFYRSPILHLHTIGTYALGLSVFVHDIWVET